MPSHNKKKGFFHFLPVNMLLATAPHGTMGFVSFPTSALSKGAAQFELSVLDNVPWS